MKTKRPSNRTTATGGRMGLPGGIPGGAMALKPASEGPGTVGEPMSFIAIDIETINPPAEVVEKAVARRLLERYTPPDDEDSDVIPTETKNGVKKIKEAVTLRVKAWEPPRSMTNQDTIKERRKEFEESLKDKAQTLVGRAALFDEAPIACIGVSTFEGAIVFNGMQSGGTVAVRDQVKEVRSGDEKTMLLDFRKWLDAHAGSATDTFSGTALVGFNIVGFDLPKLRDRYMRYQLRPPLALRVGDCEPLNPVVDLMRLYLNYCTVDFRRRPMLALKTVLEHIGLGELASPIAGAEVPNLHKQKKYDKIIQHCLDDVYAEFQAWGLISGQGEGLE